MLPLSSSQIGREEINIIDSDVSSIQEFNLNSEGAIRGKR